MAADQKRKRITGTTVLGGTSWEQYRAKKNNLGTLQNDRKFNSRVHLEWDGNQKQVIARRDQVGISRRHLRPFVDSIPHENSSLADVISVPTEIFELKNIAEVYSYEVWKTHLSEDDRNQLMQFLPKGQETEQAVQALLDGSNLHFGNPLLKWGASLCSGNLHPDSVIDQEQCLRSEKKVYYSDLQKYHNDMIEYLVTLKEIWESSKDPEKEILQNIWRPQNKAEKRIRPHSNNSGSHGFDGNVGTSSEPYSLDAEEKACSSDDQNSPVIKREKNQKRIYEKSIPKAPLKNSVIDSNDVVNAGPRSSEVHKLLKSNIQCNDGAKYMSYVKVSKKQHELLKNMKQSGRSILSRSVNRVLGDVVTSQVHPYESFVEEEQKKLHEHWLHLIKDDLPKSYANWRGIQLQVKQVIGLLGQELKTKVNLFNEEEKNLGDRHAEQKKVATGRLEVIDDSIARLEQNQTLELAQRSDTSSPQSHPEGDNEVVQDPQRNRFEEEEEEESEEDGEQVKQEVEEEEEEVEEEEEHGGDDERREEPDNGLLQIHLVEAEEVLPGCTSNQHGQHISLLKDGLNSMETVSNEFFPKPDKASGELSFCSGNLNMGVFAGKQGNPVSAGEDAWPAVSVQQLYYVSTASHGYASSGLSIVHPEVNGQARSDTNTLGSNFHDGDVGKDFLQRRPGSAFVSSYPSQDQNDFLQTSFKGPEMISNQNGQKQEELRFQGQNTALIEQSRFTGHYQQQQQAQVSLPLEQHQRRHNEAYLQRRMSEDIYSEGRGFLMSRQELLPSVDLQDWAVNPTHLPAPLQPPLTGGEFLNQHWFPNEQARSSLVGSGGSGVSSEFLGNGNMEQSLFSILPRTRVQQSTSHDPTQSIEQLVSSTHYGMGSGVMPRISNVLPQTVQSFDYMTGREAAPSMSDERLWMNLPQQNPPFNNSIGKSFLKPWNH